jgi:hypothetical protein
MIHSFVRHTASRVDARARRDDGRGRASSVDVVQTSSRGGVVAPHAWVRASGRSVDDGASGAREVETEDDDVDRGEGRRE